MPTYPLLESMQSPQDSVAVAGDKGEGPVEQSAFEVDEAAAQQEQEQSDLLRQQMDGLAIGAQASEAEQIKDVLRSETGMMEGMSEAEWNQLVEQQRALLAGQQVEEVKGEV